jgi:hypothetical protein
MPGGGLATERLLNIGLEEEWEEHTANSPFLVLAP